MTSNDELKIFASRYRWAFRELVVDRKMVESNQLQDVKPSFQYLKGRLGSGRAVLERAKAELRYTPKSVVLQGDKQFQLRVLVRDYPWVFGTVVEDEKIKEAQSLFQSVNSMYAYLLEKYKTKQEVLETLRWLVRVSKGPGKSLGLY